MNSVCSICCDGCKEHGERVERDRIIVLLEELKQSLIATNTGFGLFSGNMAVLVSFIDSLIVLIGFKK